MTIARPTRPVIGAVTRVNSRFSSAAASPADRPPPSAPLIRARTRCGDRTLRATSRSRRAIAQRAAVPTRRGRPPRRRGCAPRAADRLRPGMAADRSGTAGRPSCTTAPSSNVTLATKPDTRGRTATVSTASSRPVNSSHSVTGRSTTAATVTLGGGGCAGCAWARAHAVTIASRRMDALARRTDQRRAWRNGAGVPVCMMRQVCRSHSVETIGR